MAECDPTSFPAQCFQTRGGRLHEDDGSWGYLTYDLRVRMRLKERLDAYERGLIVAALNEASGNRTHAARALGLNRGTCTRSCTSTAWPRPTTKRTSRQRIPEAAPAVDAAFLKIVGGSACGHTGHW